VIERDGPVPITRQADLLGLSRSAVYYKPVPLSAEELALMAAIDALHLEHPFAGRRMLTSLLRADGHVVGHTHVRTLMKRMGIEALSCKPRTSTPAQGHKIFPYLLRHLDIDTPNQAWGMDITYVPMPRGFMYLVAGLDWATRRVLSWRLSNTLTADFCVEAYEAGVEEFGAPGIINTDQGSQFTGEDFVNAVATSGAQLSMDGKGAWKDNVFIERFWRTIKYEDIYLCAYDTPTHLRKGLARHIEFYNTRRPHQALDEYTPDQMYYLTALAA
jgi:putative transposase